MTNKEMVTVEKEVYESVLRNSVRVNALEAENRQLKDLLWSCQAYFNNQLNDNWAKSIVMDISNTIGENK